MKKSMTIGKRQIFLAALVLILAAAVYLNWHFSNKSGSGTVTDVYASGNMGEAVLVDSDSATQQQDQNDYFTTAKNERNKAREEQTEQLKAVAENVKTDAESAKSANEQIIKITSFKEKENNIETLVKAKGFAKCLAVINDTSVTVTVKTDGLLQSDMLQIQEIAAGETGYDLSNVKIVEIKK